MSDANQSEDKSAQSDAIVEAQEAKLNRKLVPTSVGLLILLCLGSTFAAFQGGWHAGAAALLWALAFLAIGYVAGFLFAVPRAPKSSAHAQQDDPKETPSASSGISNGLTGLAINTNLEEISDWLTKMMVGIGLVQLRLLPTYVMDIGRYVGSSLGPKSDSLAAGLVLYFFFLGFVSGYLLTRMFFSPAFMLADRATRGEVIDQKARAIASSTRQELSSAKEELKDELRADSDVETAMGELRQNPLQAGRIEQLIAALEAHRLKFPLKRKLSIVLGRLYAEGKKQYEKSITVLKQFVEKKDKADEVDEHMADALFNIACNFSRKLEGADAKRRTQYGGEALKALTRSIEIVPANAKDADTDPDLKFLRESPEFDEAVRKLLNLPDPDIDHKTPPPAQSQA